MRGFCLLVSLFASLSEALADSTLFNLHVDETMISKPRFSWTLASEDTQTSYRIQVSTAHDRSNIIWDSGIVPSSSSLVEYAGPPLFPATHCSWTVDVEVSSGSSAVASSDFTTNYPRFHNSVDELSSRQATDLGTLAIIFRTSTWIWTADGAPPLLLAPPGERFFRRTYVPPAGKTAMLAEIIITADNKFSLFVNGALVGVSPTDADSWKEAQGYRLALSPGPVVFALSVTNAPTATGGANAAGLLVGVRITHSDATQVLFGTDKTWRSNMLVMPSFQSLTFDDSKWVPATELDKFGQGPWGVLATLPTVLNAVSLPPASTSSALLGTTSTLPTSTTSFLPSTTSSSMTSSSSTTSSSASTSSSIVTVTSTSQSEDSTAPVVSPTSNPDDKSGTNPAIIGGALGGVLGAFALLGIGLLCWRRHKRVQDELVAADFDTWVPAAHANAPSMAQLSPPPSTLRQPQYPNSSDQYTQQAPYRYPPPSVSIGSGAGTGAGAAGYADQYGSGYGASTEYDTRGYGQEYGSIAQLVLPQNIGSNVPQALTPGNSQRFYSQAGAGQNPSSSPYY